MKIHPSITSDVILAAVDADDYLGFCVACGFEAGSVEPDAENYPCDDCGAPAVFGAEQLLFMTEA